VWPGAGNHNEDPLLCGYGAAEADVNDQGEFTAALQYSLALSPESPCLEAGEGGADMGADMGVCEQAAQATTLVRLAEGTYSLEGLSLANGVSVQGAGRELTVLEGTISGLRAGSVLSDVTLTRGGGIRLGAGDAPEVIGCKLTGNSMDPGGAIYCARGSSGSFADCLITKNRGRWGGGLYTVDAGPTFTDCVFEDNRVSQNGGALLCWGTPSPTFTDCVIRLNSAYEAGGGAYFGGASFPQLMGCTIEMNAAPRGGGVMCVGGSSVNLTDCVIQENATTERGGGILCEGGSPLFLVGSRVQGNSGGGVCLLDSTATIRTSTILANRTASEGNGGGLESVNSTGSVVNSVIAGNRAERGGAIYSDGSSMLFLHCTIVHNIAATGGGLRCLNEATAAPEIKNSIVWDNSPESVCGTVSFCLTDEDPLFVSMGKLNYNGTRTIVVFEEEHEVPAFVVEEPDYHLQCESPAMNAGTSEGAPDKDMEDNDRPCGPEVDLGALEYCGPSCGTPFRRGDTNADGKARPDISDGVFILGYLFLGEKDPICLDALDVDDNAKINISDPINLLNHLFLGGPEPAEPYPDCGLDLTEEDPLDCEAYPWCE
jgi:predicted outer membrane repeat protein